MPKAHEWREHIARCSESGANVHDYCAKHGLQPKSLIWWRSELRRRERDGGSGHRPKKAPQRPKARKDAPSVKLAKVVRASTPPVPPPSSIDGLRISIAGAEVSVAAGCDYELLKAALTVLREGVR